MSGLVVEGVRAGYGPVEVLRGVDLRVGAGEVAAVLGPSGCGKTTLLRLLAGHHRTSAGTVRIDDRVVAGPGRHVPPERRSVTVVPQEGALFPHLDVRANVAFGLRGQGPAAERVDRMLELVGLSDLGSRHPHQLSGGQQQRVAVARALAPRPAFVLLDEPFSALDAGLREQMRSDVRRVLHEEGCTAVIVTHDQVEALSIADTVAVMRDGVIAQQGPPAEVYARPVDQQVARFVGEALLLPVDPVDPRRTVLGHVEADGEGEVLMLRPEQLRLGTEGVPAVVLEVDYRGPHSTLLVELADATRWPVVVAGAPPQAGERVSIAVEGAGRLVRR